MQEFNTAKGVCQECVLFFMLFNIYVQKTFQIVLKGVVAEIKVNGKPINNIRYADDTTFLASNLEDLLDILDRVTERAVWCEH